MPIAALDDRAVLEVAGPDAAPFLNGLVTNDVLALAAGDQMWTALLSPQGKILFDFFIQPVAADTFWLEIEAARSGELLRRLNMYKLRAAVTMAALPDVHLYAGWEDNAPPLARPDPRLPSLGWRWATRDLLPADIPATGYHRHRLVLGVGEGAAELGIDDMLWLEANADLLNGVSFTKGCYVGQENTARMHHRHKVRKRLVPLRLAGAAPVVGLPVMAGAAEAGVIKAQVDDIALMLLRLEFVQHDLNLMGEAVHLMIPAWLKPVVAS